MNECPFCTTTEPIMKENEHAFALLSNPRKMPGHFLVMPKRHIEQPWDMNELEQKAVFELIFAIEQKIIGTLGDGCDIRQNYRPFVDQSKLKVNHVHFHVYPRYAEDYLYKVSEQYEKDLFTDLDPGEIDEIAKLLQ